MDFPWRRLAATAAVGATLATIVLAEKWSTRTFSKYLVYSWLLSFLSYGVWGVLLYPKIFSPLIGLPEPTGGSWWNGQWEKIQKLSNGAPMLEWYLSPTLLLLNRNKETRKGAHVLTNTPG